MLLMTATSAFKLGRRG